MLKQDFSASAQRHTRKVRSLPAELERRLSSYAVAASAAGVVMLATVQPAKANSIVYETVNATLTTPGSLSFSLNGARFAFNVSTYPYGGILYGGGASVLHHYGHLNAGYTIGPTVSTFARWTSQIEMVNYFGYIPSAGSFGGDFACFGGDRSMNAPCAGFIGLRFDFHGKFHYGWANLAVWATSSPFRAPGGRFPVIPAVELISVAWNRQPNAPIVTGQTSNHTAPEPGTLSLLALGAAALPFWRRKNQRRSPNS